MDLRAFRDELEKIAFKATTPQMKTQVKVREHLDADHADKDWKAFEKNLRSPTFRAAILKAQEADPTLKKYVKTFGAYQGSKDELARIKSKDSGRTYVVKDLHNGRMGCNCGDWQYVKSIKGKDCKHIKSVKQSKLVKLSHPLGLGFTMTNRTHRAVRKGKDARLMRRVLHGGALPEERDTLTNAMLGTSA